MLELLLVCEGHISVPALVLVSYNQVLAGVGIAISGSINEALNITLRLQNVIQSVLCERTFCTKGA